MIMLLDQGARLTRSYFNEDKLIDDFGYSPFYDYVLDYMESHGIKRVNLGISHFDALSPFSDEQLLEILTKKFEKYRL